MQAMIIAMSSKAKNILFGSLYAILACFAVLPPLYLAGSGNTALFLGAPLSMWYWIADFALLLVVMFALYKVESIRGEVGDEAVLTSGEGD